MQLVLDLANVSDDTSYFRKHWLVDATNQTLTQRRAEIRRALESPEACAEAISRWWTCSFARGSFLYFVRGQLAANPGDLESALAVVMATFRDVISLCANPGCDVVFRRSRSTQRFCDKAACTHYAAREHKRKWWKKHGKKWRADRR